jgi:hypothetical protein
MKARYQSLKAPVETEMNAARSARREGDVARAWNHLERAHVLSQPSAVLHTRVHWRMLVLALVTLDVREIFGQAIRLVLAAPSSAFARFPLGNVGSTRVGLLTPMPIGDDLKAVLDAAEVSAHVMAGGTNHAPEQ